MNFASNKTNNDKTNKSTFKDKNHNKSGLTCYICNKVGHIAKDCRLRSSHQKKNSQYIKDNDKKSNDRKEFLKKNFKSVNVKKIKSQMMKVKKFVIWQTSLMGQC